MLYYIYLLIVQVSTDCPRGEQISKIIKDKIPAFLRKIIGNKKPKIVSDSFYEESICDYFGDES